MASVGALGIGLSVVFGVFLVLLLAELYYLLFWKRKSLIASSRVTSASVVDPAAGTGGGGGGDGGGGDEPTAFVAKMYESRGIMGSEVGMIGLDGTDFFLAPPRLLFTIKEEGREDLVDSADDLKQAPATAGSLRIKRPGHVVVELLPPEVKDRGLLHVCSTSSPSSSGEESSGSSSSSSSGDDVTAMAAAEIDLDPAPAPALVSASIVDIDGDDGSMSSTTPFVTPPSSPAFSTPASSPERQQSPAPPARAAGRRAAPRLSYESPPSPPLQPMPVPLATGGDDSHAGMTPLSVSSSMSSTGRDSFSSARRSRRSTP